MNSSKGFRSCTAAALAIALIETGAALGQGLDEGVWVRNFPPPAHLRVQVPGNEQGFAAWAPGPGLLRYPTGQLWVGGAGCLVQVALVPAPTGYDLNYTISNPTAAPLPLPRLELDGHVLETQIEYLNHRMGCIFATLVADGSVVTQYHRTPYPERLYAPAIIMRDSRVSVGLALHYPMLEYKHQIEVQIRREPGHPWWKTRFWLMDQLPAQTTRTYRVSVRYNLPDDWIHTMEPYRDYFQSLYGVPRYVQDLRPVYGTSVAQPEYQALDNQRGMSSHRPDLHGWLDAVNFVLVNAQADGFQRVMIWKPSGLYYNNPDNNLPPQFMSQWNGPMLQTAPLWLLFGWNGIDLGFWWGRAAQYADQWDDDVLEPFDPQNPVQRAAMMSEWNLAVSRGATGVALDAIKLMPPWDSLPWIDAMLAVLPTACIVSEPACNDVVHVHTPTFVQSRHIPTPHFLADYLVPGREMWAHLVNNEDHPNEVSLARALELVSWGMTVCVREGEFTVWDLEQAIGSGTVNDPDAAAHDP